MIYIYFFKHIFCTCLSVFGLLLVCWSLSQLSRRASTGTGRDSNPEPSCCEAPALTTTPRCRLPRINDWNDICAWTFSVKWFWWCHGTCQSHYGGEKWLTLWLVLNPIGKFGFVIETSADDEKARWAFGNNKVINLKYGLLQLQYLNE